MTKNITIDICLCTFRRDHIVDTLRSLAQLDLLPEWNVRIIVADNDDTPSAKTLVESTVQDFKLPVTYIHAPARNISIARNACLDAAEANYIAFIDDDEIAPKQWLQSLMSVIIDTKSDVVLGSVKAIYQPDYPQWMREGNFHATMPVWVNGEIITGYSCNVIFTPTTPALKNLRFRSELGKSGGEDTVFFNTVYNTGGKISFAPEAWLSEEVPQGRASFYWLLKRRFRSGQTHGLLLLEKEKGIGVRLKNTAIALTKFIFCLLSAICSFYNPVLWRRWILRGILHAGVISRLLGKRELEQYGA